MRLAQGSGICYLFAAFRLPYLAAGGGYMRQKTLVGTGPGSTALATFTSTEATASGGIGARIALGSHVFVAPEFRLGWEPETRIAVTIGIRPGGRPKRQVTPRAEPVPLRSESIPTHREDERSAGAHRPTATSHRGERRVAATSLPNPTRDDESLSKNLSYGSGRERSREPRKCEEDNEHG
jgi:hypothetical protein